MALLCHLKSLKGNAVKDSRDGGSQKMAMQRYEHKGSSTLSLALRNDISFCVIFQETYISHE